MLETVFPFPVVPAEITANEVGFAAVFKVRQNLRKVVPRLIAIEQRETVWGIGYRIPLQASTT